MLVMKSKPIPSNQPEQLPIELVEHRIFIIRGQKVMLDSDLADLYGVTTKRLNEQVKRNLTRFPQDFMFKLSIAEAENLRSQFATSSNRSQIATGSQKHRDPRYLPYVFTEHGAVMLASVLNSPIAIQASIQVVRAFIRLRSILAAHKELAEHIDKLEKDTKYSFEAVFELIDKYLKPPQKPKPKIGFRTGK